MIDYVMAFAFVGGLCLGVAIMVPFGIWWVNMEYEKYHESGWTTRNRDWDYD